MQRKIILLCFIFLSFLEKNFAKHIIGGIITYEFKGDGNYNFDMKIYRDCKGGGAAFDGASDDNLAPQAAIIGIYREDNGIFTFVTTKLVKLSSKSEIAPPTYPCMGVPPNICVEEGIYEWDYKIPDFPSKSIYHFVYQRCCRNNTIINIVNAKDIGATYTVAITPESQAAKNSSPTFNNFPPTIICANIPFKIDHSAKDADGDILVYKLCSPLEGGGPTLNGNGIYACNGVRPNPACPPPFNPVIFSAGYSSFNPLGQNADFKINPNTGLMTSVPKIVGQFVVGVCVEEYRNGVLLSKVFRDFQFNVDRCEALVAAGVVAVDTSLIQKKYTIRSCGLDQILFKNGSSQEKYIKSYLWNFDIAGQTITSTEKNPLIKFPGLGIYKGFLVANPGLQPCSDTAKLEIQIYPGLKADFKYAYDTCVAGAVKFTDLSTAGSGQIDKWVWTYKDGNKGSVQNPSHEYKIPGTFGVQLKITDKNKCEDTLSRPLRYYPVPPLILVKPDTARGCTPMSVQIKNLSYPIDKSYKILWDMGDGSTSSDISPRHIYEKLGVYSLSVSLESPIGCKSKGFFPNLIEVAQSPIADFSFTPEKLTSLQNTAVFTDKSQDAYRWAWQFGVNESSSSQKNPTYSFRDTGLHVIRLIATNPSGCRDTTYKKLDVEPVVKYFLPNAFTPNFDSKNDEFKGTGLLDGISDFRLSIFNRWGERIYETNDPETGWNGRKNNVGEMSPDGVYVYYVTFNGPRNKTFSYKGFATLLK